MLSSSAIERFLRGDHPWRIHLFDEIGSTMTEAQRMAEEGAPAYSVALAESQTAGTGRHDRPWYSPAADGLWMTALLRPKLAPDQAPWLTLGAAVAVAEALDDAGFSVGIKWPNDVLSAEGSFARRKLCGIRAEMRLDEMGQLAWASVGIGLNVHQEQFPQELADVAASLQQLSGGMEPPRSECAGLILNHLEEIVCLLEGQGFCPVRDRWLALALGVGQEATVRDIEGEQHGIVRGMDEVGHLLLEVDGGTVSPVIAGDLIFTV